MEIIETMHEKSVSLATGNAYFAALDAVKRIAERIKITERRNVYETDGPFHRCEIVAAAVEEHDKFSRTVFTITFLGEDRALEIRMEGRFETRIKERGFFSETFAQFYMEKAFPLARRRAERRIREIAQQVEPLCAARV